MRFTFHDPGALIDQELELVLVETVPGALLGNRVPYYHFAMRRVGEREDIGGISLRIGNTPYILLYAGHIGYGVKAAYRGNHYAARSCRLLAPLAGRHGLTTLWITCNPDNFASRRTCELVGARMTEIVTVPRDCDIYRNGDRQKCRYQWDISMPAPAW